MHVNFRMCKVSDVNFGHMAFLDYVPYLDEFALSRIDNF